MKLNHGLINGICYTIINGMDNTTIVTMDGAGRLVVPKAVREEAGILPGTPLRIACREGRIEIEPVPRNVRIVERGGFQVAEPLTKSDPLPRAVVKRTKEEIRTGRRRR